MKYKMNTFLIALVSTVFSVPTNQNYDNESSRLLGIVGNRGCVTGIGGTVCDNDAQVNLLSNGNKKEIVR